MTPICPAIKRDGSRCTQSVPHGATYCHHHAPERAEARSRSASRAGRSRGGGGAEVQEIRGLLQDLTSGVLDHQINSGVASVIVQLSNARIRLIEVERRLLETQELEQRIEQLEERTGAKSGPRRAR